jgi:Sel1 repeat
MSAPSTVDFPSFEKLLNAAWVLQCQLDKAPREVSASAIAEPGMLTSNIFPRLDHGNDVQAQTGGGREPLSGEAASADVPQVAILPVTEQIEVAPASAFTPERNASVPDACAMQCAEDTAPQIEDPRLLRAKAESVSSTQVRERKRFVTKLRVIIPDRSLVLIRASVAPVVLLLIIAAFLLSLPFSQRPAQASQRLWAQDFQQKLQAHKIRFTESLSSDAESGSRQQFLNSIESSHLRITDPATAAVLRNLSPHEMQGLERQAEYGDVSAAVALGMAYETGRYVHQNCTKAAKWIAVAAASGNSAAEYNLGLRYLHGDGVPQDSVEAMKWLEKANANGYVKTAAVEAQ